MAAGAAGASEECPTSPGQPAPVGAVHRLTLLTIETAQPQEWVDLTAALTQLVDACGLHDGAVSLHTCHTTTGLVINELEPLLLGDLDAMFERVAPRHALYAHDDKSRRLVNRVPGERRNGHAHCRAALVPSSQVVHVGGGALRLGRWQRLLFVEFDGPQRRQVSVLLAGSAAGGAPRRAPHAERPRPSRAARSRA